MDKLEEIFQLQAELNDRVYAKNGMKDNAGQPLTTLAVQRELAQGLESLAALADPTKERGALQIFQLGPNGLPNRMLRNHLLALQAEGIELERELLWKWWSKDRIDVQNIRVEIIDLMHFLVSLAQCAGLDAAEFHRLYTAKLKVNENRQEKNYSKATKDEADNKAIV